MASGGGGFGRGRLLQQLKLEKITKPEEKEEEKKVEIKQESKSLIEEELSPPSKSTITAIPETKPRFMGRGILSTLGQVKKAFPESTVAAGDTEQVKRSPLFTRKITVSQEKPPSPPTPPSKPSSLSQPSPPSPPRVEAPPSPPRVEAPPSPPRFEAPPQTIAATSGLQQRPSILLSKGRGKLATAVKPEDIPDRTIPAVPVLQPEVIKPVVPTYKPPSVEPSGAGPKSSISAGGASTGRTTSQLASDTSQKTMEKATEELTKVEEVKRASPVTRIGTSGTHADLSANYIKLRCKNAGVYQYVVHFDPPVEAHSSRMRMVGSLRDIIGSVRLFDGHTLFLPKMLKDTVTIAKAKRPTDQVETTLRIQLTKILPPEQIPPVVFNIIFRNVMNELKMKQIGQHYFNPMKHISIPKHNLDIWPGYITAVHEFQDGLYLVADVAHKVIRSETVLNLLMDLRKRNLPNFKEEATNQLVGCIVLTPYNNRTYRIDDILWDLSPRNKFMYHDGQECSYAEYYKNHYGIEISDLNQPLLLNRGKKSKQNTRAPQSPQQQQQQSSEMICLIPELCCMTGLTDEIRKDFRAMKDMANHTRITPNDRFKSLIMFIDSIKSCPNAYKHIQNWGLELDDDTIAFDGRILNREEIHTRNDKFLSSEQCDWNREITRKEVLQAVDIRNWMIVFTRKDANIAEKFVDMMYGCSKQMGIRVNEPYVVEVPDDRADTYVREIKKSLNDQTQLVLIVFPTARDDRYAAVKRLCCIECPVPSQVVNAKTIFEEKTLRSVTQKIMLQINCKLGGELWRLSIPIQRLMVVGIDVYHQIEKKYKSIAGFVSSLNNDQTRWHTKVCFQMTGQELIDSLKIAFMQSLKKYQEVNNCLPEKIIIYRDGVSDGQLTYVTEHEVQQLRSCFGENYSPKLAVCIVQKRINTRIFLESKGRNREFTNAPSGAIVDHLITRRDLYDFFLVSQHVRQGTVTPTHYIIVYDDTSFQPDHMQRLSYKLTHLYYNWPGTIRVPAPCQYAHKVAYLTGQFLQKEPDSALCNRLFYL